MTGRLADAPQRHLRSHRAHHRVYGAACELLLSSRYLGTCADGRAERAHLARQTAFNHRPRKRHFTRGWGSRRRQPVATVISPRSWRMPAES